MKELADQADPGAQGDSDTAVSDRLDEVGRASIGRNLLHLMSSQVVTWALATVVLVLQPRFLGDEAIGDLRLAMSLWAMAQVLMALGTSYYLTLEIARDRRAGMAKLLPVVAVRTLAWAVSFTLLVGFVALRSGGRSFTAIMALFGVMSLLITLSDAIGAAFSGLEQMGVPATIIIVSRVIGTVAGVSVLLLGGDAVTLMTVSVCTTMLGLALHVRAVRPYITWSFAGWRPIAVAAIRHSSGFLVAAFVLVTYQQIDTVVISLLVDREVLGWYATADVLFGTLLFIPTIVTASIFPVLGRLHQDDPGGLTSLVERTFSTIMVAAVPVGLGTMIVGPDLAPALFGEEFRPSGEVLFALGPVIVCTFATVLFGTVALSTGRQRLWNAVMVAGAVLTIPLDLVLVPWADRRYGNGAIGGAMAYAVTESIMVVIGFWKVVPFLLTRSTCWRLVRVSAAGGLMFAAAWPVRHEFIAIPIAVGVVAFAVAAIALGAITAQDREFAVRALRRTH